MEGVDGSSPSASTILFSSGVGALLESFVAIDFETADHGSDSACSVGVVRVENGQIVAEAVRLIRPPRPDIRFTAIHGIRWEDVQSEPLFGQVWPALAPLLEGVDFLAAHNSGFDRKVLKSCCEAAGLVMPSLPFECTVAMARKVWGVFPTKLPDVCRHLGLELKHHEALSDARACAGIVQRAQQAGWQRRAPKSLSA